MTTKIHKQNERDDTGKNNPGKHNIWNVNTGEDNNRKYNNSGKDNTRNDDNKIDGHSFPSLASQISEGFSCNKPAKRTADVAIDISKAFDLVDTTFLLKQISESELHHSLVRWLSAYLRGRSVACIYQGAKSRH
jgi:hypothetical protein